MIPFLQTIQGDALTVLRGLADESAQMCVTSPPYYGLRSYSTQPQVWGGSGDCLHDWEDSSFTNPNASGGQGEASKKQNKNVGSSHADYSSRTVHAAVCSLCGAWRGELGHEPTPEIFIEHLVSVFREVRRVLKSNGTCWVNIGDTYAGSWGAMSYPKGSIAARRFGGDGENCPRPVNSRLSGSLKAKDLIGIPWMLAFALRADGWYLRSDIVWAKKNCMPESVTDRPTRSHEYLFLLSKSPRYHYDHEAIKEPALYDVDGTGTASRKARARVDLKSHPTEERAGIRPSGFKDATKMNGKNGDKQRGHSRRHAGFNDRWDLMEKEEQCTGMRNKRDVWTVAPAIYPDAHFATYPPDLIRPCILAGCPVGGVVLDPFAGSGTTGKVALELGRKAILIELNPEYHKLIEKRTTTTLGLPMSA